MNLNLLKSAEKALISAYEKELDDWLEKFKSSSFEEKTRTILKFTDVNIPGISMKYMVRISKIVITIFDNGVYEQHINLELLFDKTMMSLIKLLKRLLPSYFSDPRYLQFVRYLIEETVNIPTEK